MWHWASRHQFHRYSRFSAFAELVRWQCRVFPMAANFSAIALQFAMCIYHYKVLFLMADYSRRELLENMQFARGISRFEKVV
jgi:hypothetical protein